MAGTIFMRLSSHRFLRRFSLSILVLMFCALTPQVKSQTDGADRKPNVKLWKSEKEAGEAAFKNNDMTGAESHFKAALDESEHFGPKDDRLAESLTESGDFYARMAKYAAAEPLLQRAVDMRRGDPNAMTEAYVQFLLGYTRIELQHYDDAEKAFLRAQELYSRKAGPDNPLAVRCMFYLGMIYDERHEYAKAEPLLKRSALLFEHPATRTTMHRKSDPAAYAGSDVWITKYRPDYIYAVEAQARLGGGLLR
jgi:tetratricopeptide (TPR) repeat protein